MEMVGHKSIGIKIIGITIAHLAEAVQKRFVIGVLQEHLLPIITPSYYMEE